MNQPPMPTSVRQDIEVKSLTNPDYRFVLQPVTRQMRSMMKVFSRESEGHLGPIRSHMREILRKKDFGKHFDTEECARVHAIIQAFEDQLLDMTPEDVQLFELAESIAIAENPEFSALCYQEENIVENQTLQRVAMMLKAVWIGDKQHTWANDETGRERYDYLLKLEETSYAEVENLKLQAANLIRVSRGTEKNSEPLSGSSLDRNHSEEDSEPSTVPGGS